MLPEFPHVQLCVALSGGADSCALLAALADVKPRPQKLRAIHIDHGLQPDASEWRAHCLRLAQQLSVPIEIFPVAIARRRRASLEALAREARYAELARHLAPGEVLLTAHHEDDQLETVLLQLFRGAGTAGLAAMPDIAPFAAGRLARPLLACTHAQLQTWLRSRGLTWVEDPMNADEGFDRNYLRRRLIPLIRARWPGVGAAVSRSARHAAEAQRLLDLLARADVDRAANAAQLSVQSLRALPPDRRRNALRFWIARSGAQLPDSRRLEELAGPLIDARADANPQVRWGETLVRRHAGLMWISRRNGAGSELQRPALRWPWRSSPRLVLPDGMGALEIRPAPRGPIDLAALPATLEVRWRTGGERLRPRRGGPRRSLKRLLQEARWPLEERPRLPLVFGAGRLLAAGSWVDESIQPARAARRRGRLHWVRQF